MSDPKLVVLSDSSYGFGRSPLDFSSSTSVPPFLLQLGKNEKLQNRKESLRNIIQDCQAVETERDADEMSVHLIEIIISHLNRI